MRASQEGCAGLGRVPGLGKGPQGETWLCSEWATRAPPSAGSGWGCQREGRQQPLAGLAPSPTPTGLSPIRWGVQMSQQLSKMSYESAMRAPMCFLKQEMSEA